MRGSLHGVSPAASSLVTLVITGMSVAACDGAGWTGPTSVDQSPGCLYTGSFTSTVTQPSPCRQTIGVVSEDFDAQLLLIQQRYAGTLTVDGTTLSGVLTEYSGRQSVFIGFDGVTTVSVDGGGQLFATDTAGCVFSG